MEMSEHVIDFEKRCYKVTSSGRFHSGLDGEVKLCRRHNGWHAVASILRWSLGSFQSWSDSDTTITFEYKTEIHGTTVVRNRGRQMQ
jgi:hypothetical protein